MQSRLQASGLVLVAAALSAGCGKRGDPLPPLRPVPATAEQGAIRQVGDVLELSWVAPVRNQDGTGENLELAEVEIRRRIVDLPDLIEEQTVWPTEEGEAGEEEGDADTENDLAPAESLAGIDRESLPEQALDAVSDVAAAVEEELETAPSRPALQIPDFAPESRPVLTRVSTVPGERLSYEDALDPEWIGKRVEYAVVYTNRKKRRGPRSSVVRIDPIEPLSPPTEVKAEAADGFVRVRWVDAPALPVEEGEEPTHRLTYAVYRRPADAGGYPDQPLNPAGASESPYRDGSARFGQSLCYAVKTVLAPIPPEPEPVADPESPEVEDASDVDLPEPVDEPEPLADEPVVLIPVVPAIANPVRLESVASEEVCLTPRDRFPPPRPTGLVAVATGSEVLLTWTGVNRPDVAGYRIYRGATATGPFERVTEEVVTVPSFTDTTVSSGGTYFYAVTSIDTSPERNESGTSDPSRVQVP